MSSGGSTTAKEYDVLMDAVGNPAGEHGAGAAEPDRRAAPWESSLQATFDCLSWRGALDNLERRHAEDELGETVYAEFPLHARPALVSAHLLMDRGIITQDELRAKLAEVRARLLDT